jgi:hypothetical protein
MTGRRITITTAAIKRETAGPITKMTLATTTMTIIGTSPAARCGETVSKG